MDKDACMSISDFEVYVLVNERTWRILQHGIFTSINEAELELRSRQPVQPNERYLVVDLEEYVDQFEDRQDSQEARQKEEEDSLANPNTSTLRQPVETNEDDIPF